MCEEIFIQNIRLWCLIEEDHIDAEFQIYFCKINIFTKKKEMAMILAHVSLLAWGNVFAWFWHLNDGDVVVVTL